MSVPYLSYVCPKPVLVKRPFLFTLRNRDGETTKPFADLIIAVLQQLEDSERFKSNPF
eukprot:COSAG06_NODE_29702_length_551_cov_3.285398_1_plen_57_part_10